MQVRQQKKAGKPESRQSGKLLAGGMETYRYSPGSSGMVIMV